MGAASPGAGQLPTRLRWGESCLQGQKHNLFSTWPWKHLKLYPDHVFVASPQERRTVPALELETLNLSLSLADCVTFEQTVLWGPL